MWSRLTDPGETGCQPAPTTRALLKGQHPRAGQRALVGSKSGTTFTARAKYCAGASAGGELEAGRAVACDWGRSKSWARGGTWGLRAIFARRLMESCKPMPNRPAPDARASLISGREAAWLQHAQDESKVGTRPAKACSMVASPTRVSPATLQPWLRGTMATMARLPTAFFPVKAPLPRPQ